MTLKLSEMTVRVDLLGVTSIVRALGLSHACYDRILDFFHGTGLKLDKLARVWTQTVLTIFPSLPRVNGRLLLVGDGDVSRPVRLELRNATPVNVGIVVGLAMQAEAMWKRAAYLMQPPVLRQLGVHPFAAISAPRLAMVVYAVLYVAAALAVAVAVFGRRDL